VGAKILRDYAVGAQTSSGGPGSLWKIHTARCKREGAANALVSVWFLEKRPPDDMRHASSQRWEEFLELCRRCDHAMRCGLASALACIKTPCVPTARCTACCLLDACASLTRRPVRLCRDAANMTRLKHPGGPSALEPLFAEAEQSLEPHASHCGLQAL